MSAMFAAGRAIPKIEPTDSAGPRSSWMVQPPPPRLSQVQQVQAQVQAQQQAASQQQPQSQSQPAQHSLCKIEGFSFNLILYILLGTSTCINPHCFLAAVPHVMPGMGAMNPGPGPVMVPPVPPTQAQQAQGNGVHHASQANSPTDQATMAMQQQQQQQQPPPGGGPNGGVSNSSGAAGTGNQYGGYGAPPTGAQMQNVGNDVGKFSSGTGSGPTGPSSVQQNGYVTQSGQGQAAGGGSYGTAQQASAQQQATAGGQGNAGGGPGGAQNSGSGGTSGTWTGPNTLTYTQSMQPPDPRSLTSAYCK